MNNQTELVFSVGNRRMIAMGDMIYCPVCSTGREKPKARQERVFFLVWALGGALLLGAIGALLVPVSSALLLALFGGLLTFVILEARASLRLRHDVICPVCHFDPVLYRRAPEKAKQRCLDSLKLREDVLQAKWQALKNPA